MTTPDLRPRRGSRKHVLDWVEQPGFLQELEALVVPAPCRIPPDAIYLPRGHAEPAEARLDVFGRRVLPDHPAWDELRGWWLRHPKGANTPNWDLAVTCQIEDRPGLLLVEAKANVPELSEAGKAPVREDPRRGPLSAQRSAENAEQILAAIDSARSALEPQLPGISISRNRHYQLSNRLAFSWKLASYGIPTVLLYLGITGDTGMLAPLRDEAEWQALFRRHLAAVCPSGIAERPIRTGAAEFWVLCRARRVLEPSPGARND
jgi:hypothetical protein